MIKQAIKITLLVNRLYNKLVNHHFTTKFAFGSHKLT